MDGFDMCLIKVHMLWTGYLGQDFEDMVWQGWMTLIEDNYRRI